MEEGPAQEPVTAGTVWSDEDARLLAAVAAGDGGAFEALYDRHSRVVYSLARKMLSDTQAAMEVTQEVFEGIWRGARAFAPGRGTARGWILSLAHHKSVDAMRRQRLRTTEPLSETQTGDVDVVAQVLTGVVGAEVRSALGNLSEAHRTVLVLAYYGGYTQREIAQRLNVPLGTIKTRMRDGLLKLRGLLGTAAAESAK